MESPKALPPLPRPSVLRNCCIPIGYISISAYRYQPCRAGETRAVVYHPADYKKPRYYCGVLLFAGYVGVDNGVEANRDRRTAPALRPVRLWLWLR